MQDRPISFGSESQKFPEYCGCFIRFWGKLEMWSFLLDSHPSLRIIDRCRPQVCELDPKLIYLAFRSESTDRSAGDNSSAFNNSFNNCAKVLFREISLFIWVYQIERELRLLQLAAIHHDVKIWYEINKTNLWYIKKY